MRSEDQCEPTTESESECIYMFVYVKLATYVSRFTSAFQCACVHPIAPPPFLPAGGDSPTATSGINLAAPAPETETKVGARLSPHCYDDRRRPVVTRACAAHAYACGHKARDTIACRFIRRGAAFPPRRLSPALAVRSF